MASREVRKVQREGVLNRLADEATIRQDVLDEFAAFEGFRSKPRIDLHAGTYVSLFRFTRAEQGGEKCPFDAHNCDFSDSCTGDPCLRNELASRENSDS